MVYCYKSFGMNIRSELELPELLGGDFKPEEADIEIRMGIPKKCLSEESYRGVIFEAGKEEFILELKNVAKYYLNSKNKKIEIVIAKMAGAEEKRVRLYLLGSVFGAALMLRNRLVLHANTLQIGDKTVAFSGISGAGKSTISAAFLQQGAKLIADDVSPIDLSKDRPEILSGFPRLKLWEDTAKRVGLKLKNLDLVMSGYHKYSLMTKNQFASGAKKIDIIYILGSSNDNNFSFKKISGIQKYTMLRANSYRLQYLKGLGLEKIHFGQCMKLVKHVAVTQIIRPNYPFRLKQLVKYVEKDLGV